MYNNIKQTLQKTGELMVKVSDGQTFELHLHNTKFHDETNLIELDAGAETYWINAEEVVYMWIHRVKE
ncbi:MAG: hypothetical protein KatS3mg090_0518 [Patescibacteria group bacterium]|nr:MAG: hypothetical protein KatS3mg090_0518 [Patescibacteria group bacterium]